MQNLKVYRYQLPMTLTSIPVREGLLVSYINSQGEEAWHEIAPLPSWNKESLDQVIANLHKIKSQLPSLSLEDVQNAPSSIQFALQSFSLFSIYDPSPISVCGHLMGTIDQMAKDVELLLSQGCKTVKVKTSHLSPSVAKSFLQDLSLFFSLRIDINQAWDLQETEKALSGISINKIDYVEDPFHNPEDLQSFSFPFALDETLRKPYPSFLEDLPNFKAIIIKPTMQGTFDEKSPLFQMAKKKNLSIVLSSSFESSVGIYQIARLAKHLGLSLPMGIGTYRYFSEDILEIPLHIEKGNLIFPTKIEPKWKYLTPI